MTPTSSTNAVTKRFRIYLRESDKWKGQIVWREILELARREPLLGCTVWHGLTSFGTERLIHSTFVAEGATERPVILEIVEEAERMEAFLKRLGPLLQCTFIVDKPLSIREYRAENQAEDAYEKPVAGEQNEFVPNHA